MSTDLQSQSGKGRLTQLKPYPEICIFPTAVGCSRQMWDMLARHLDMSKHQTIEQTFELSLLGRLIPARFAWYASGNQRRHRFLRRQDGVWLDTSPTRIVHITNGSTEPGRSLWICAPTQRDDAVTPAYSTEKIHETPLHQAGFS